MKQEGRIVLASASPRRREFLEMLGLEIEVLPSEIAEVGYGGDPALLPLRIATQKLKAVRARLGPSFDGWIISADTVVALENEILGKPRNREDAARMLEALSGKMHRVYTGVRIDAFDGQTREVTVKTDVEFGSLSDSDIAWYLASGEADDKAGAYGIQGLGGRFIKTINGSYSNVVGLPLYETVQILTELEAIRRDESS